MRYLMTLEVLLILSLYIDIYIMYIIYRINPAFMYLLIYVDILICQVVLSYSGIKVYYCISEPHNLTSE